MLPKYLNLLCWTTEEFETKSLTTTGFEVHYEAGALKNGWKGPPSPQQQTAHLDVFYSTWNQVNLCVCSSNMESPPLLLLTVPCQQTVRRTAGGWKDLSK